MKLIFFWGDFEVGSWCNKISDAIKVERIIPKLLNNILVSTVFNEWKGFVRIDFRAPLFV